MKIELLNGFTRVNPQDTQNEFTLEGRKRRGQKAIRKARQKLRQRSSENPTRERIEVSRSRAVERNNPQRMSKSRVNQMTERRAKAGTRRLTPQQQVINSYTLNGDANYFIKDNAVYSDAQLEQKEMNFPMALVGSVIAGKMGKGKKSKGIPRADRKKARKQARIDKRKARRLERETKKQGRVDDRQEARRTTRTDRQEAKRKRQEQRQQMKLAKQQAKQDRKLAQTTARQQDNIIKAQAKAGAVESGDTFGQRAGSLLSNVGEGAKNLISNNPEARGLVGDFIEDRTGINIGGRQAGAGIPFDDDYEDFEQESFIEKYKMPLLIGGGLVGAYLLMNKGKKKK